MSEPSFQWRIFRSPHADYCSELTDIDAAYPRSALRQIRLDGYNALWLRVILRETVPTTVFPSLIPDPQAIPALREIVQCCRNEGLGVFVYLNEPLGFPEDAPFWRSHPETRGELDSSFDDGWDRANALCTSEPKTLAFLEEATERLFTAVPELAGAILITASEHLTHCYSHASRYRNAVQFRLQCVRCSEATPQKVVGAIVGAIANGVKRAGSQGEVVAWNWSWSFYEAAPQIGMLEALPPGVTVLVDFERGGMQSLLLADGPVEIAVDEYSLGYTGPSSAYEMIAEAAATAGKRVMAKLQIGTTHEIATVPNLPLVKNLYWKFRHLHKTESRGFLGCWCFGTFPSLNTFAAGWLAAHPELEESEALHAIAEAYFPGCNAQTVAEAWTLFSEAFKWFPQAQDFLYVGPVNVAPAYLWPSCEEAIPMQPSWFPQVRFGTMVEQALGPLSLEQMIGALAQLLEVWGSGLARYKEGLASAVNEHAEREWRVAKMIDHQLQSTRNLLAYFEAQRSGDLERVSLLARREIAQLQEALSLVKSDPRLGFHQGSFPGPCFFYDEALIDAKIANLERLLH